MTANNRCRTCGACCACFTAVVDPTEMKTPEAYHPPFDLIAPMKSRGHVMKGTEGKQKRCAALNGVVGAERKECEPPLSKGLLARSVRTD